jgi:DNA polymerase IV
VRVGSLVKQGTAQATPAPYSSATDNATPQVNEHGQTQLLFPLD